MRLVILSLLVFGMLLAGCFTPPPEQNQTNETNTTDQNTTVYKNPSFTIVSPTSGEVILTQENVADVTLSLNTQNLVLKQPGGVPKKGEGHFKVTVDNNPAITVTSKNYVIAGLAVGEHTVKVALWTNDQKSYGMDKQVTFIVEKEIPPPYVPKDYTVTIKDFSYEPADLTVKVSDRVTFVNTGNFPRSATCFIDGKQVFDTNVLGHGQNVTLTMNQMLNCEYYSVTHPIMKGRVIVESNAPD
ncbi:Uncharacterised protein [Candidatus Bilamarchaeum dharawalense]|uniref:Blue (type 1) copper domain-containing protein n=1 Tax=Candidatus Bilamarchaeum dharawalense TaxID=2885759 RepID=A0A5E4LN00_9ARCH|nr:Uncharacterised protein [Candidatus Bilamarchaeum dharawalense]